MDTIYEYDTSNDIWTNLKVKMPEKLSFFGCTSILYNKYVVLFGGRYKKKKDSIWIYSVCDRTFKESKLLCPRKGCFRAFTISDRKRDEMVTFGFVRIKWKECGINDHLFPPQYLIRIIHYYFLNEHIHLFDISEEGGHWKIDALNII